MLYLPPAMAERIRLFFIGSLFLGVLACSPRPEVSPSNDPLDPAYRKIDRQDYDGAIADLQSLATLDSHPRVREALASAYAGRAGILIHRYWGFLVGFRAPLLSQQRIDSSDLLVQARRIISQMEGGMELGDDRPLGRLARVIGTMDLWRERIDRLPIVTEPARQDLLKALEILDGVPSPGSRLYRALLGLVILKSDLEVGFVHWARLDQKLRGFDFARPRSAANRRLLCEIDVRTFSAWAGRVLRRLESTALDVSVAFPSKKSEIDGAVGQSRRVSAALLGVGERTCER